jgi:hypothetical protein
VGRFPSSQDKHEREFDDWEVETAFFEIDRTADGTRDGLGFVERNCHYFISIYPSKVFEEEYKTSTPWILVSVVAGTFLFAIGMFFVYDRLVERRQMLVLQKAVQSTAIVSSLFPKAVRDRLMNSPDASSNLNVGSNAKTLTAFRDRINKNGDMVGTEQPDYGEEETIADLFPHCTVMFADISGFTAWSSTRDPSQVFTLLQNLYQAFDKIALRRRVFKVETIGDSCEYRRRASILRFRVSSSPSSRISLVQTLLRLVFPSLKRITPLSWQSLRAIA